MSSLWAMVVYKVKPWGKGSQRARIYRIYKSWTSVTVHLVKPQEVWFIIHRIECSKKRERKKKHFKEFPIFRTPSSRENAIMMVFISIAWVFGIFFFTYSCHTFIPLLVCYIIFPFWFYCDKIITAAQPQLNKSTSTSSSAVFIDIIDFNLK